MSRKTRRVALRLVIYPALVITGLSLAGTLFTLFPRRLVSETDPGRLGLPSREVTFAAPGGPPLRGWLVSDPDARGNIVCLHGYPADKGDILPAVSFLFPEFNLLLFDFRALGESGGLMSTLGGREKKDVLAALEFLEGEPETRDLPTGLWGYSMGGATALLAAAERPGIRAVATDSAYASLAGLVSIYYRPLGPLSRPVSFLSRGFFRLLAGMPVGQVSPESVIAEIDAPLLIVHNRHDPVIPADHAARLYGKARGSKKLLVGEQGIHGAASDPEHRETLRLFFLENLAEKTPLEESFMLK